MSDRIFLSPPYMGGEELDFIKKAFDTNWIAPLGENVDRFESEIAEYIGVKKALATSSGTGAIHLALRYYDVKPGDTVICSDLTFSGSCNSICYQFATPIFVDSEEQSWNMSPQALEDALKWSKANGKLPKAAIIVDLYGQSADYDELLPLLKRYGVPVIEDAAEALGASYGGRKCGSFGDVSIQSFNGNKIITTSGGGMALSDDEALISKLRFWATQARERAPHYEHKEYGYNYRLSNVLAGVGLGQMRILDKKLEHRRSVYDNYVELLAKLPVALMPVHPKGMPNFWLTCIAFTDERIDPMKAYNALEAQNIESRPLWKPMHMQPVFSGAPYFDNGAVGERLFKRGLCLPSGDDLSSSDQEKIVDIIKGAVL